MLEADGQRDKVSQTRGSDVTTIDWTYDAMNRLTGESYDGPGSGTDYVATYSFDLASNRVKKVQSGYQAGTTAYRYNADDQLTAEGPDTNGDGDPDGLTATSYEYDANGSLTSTTPPGGSTMSYLWDLRNRMVGIDADNDGDAGDSGVTKYGYDHEGVRVSQTAGGAGGSTTYFLNDPNNPTGYTKAIEQKPSPSAAPSRSFVLGHKVEAQRDATNGTQYLLTDGHGSTRALIGTGGATAESYDYDAFGNAIGFTAATAKTPWLFGGDGLFDPASGWTYHLARWRQDFRFVSFDSFEGDPSSPVSLHKYLYANANPIYYTDPTGNFADFSFGLSGDFGGTTRPGVLDIVRDMIPAMDWMGTNDAFELAEMHQTIMELQIDAIGQHIRSQFGRVMAASRFAFAMMDFLQDFVYIDPMQLALGWIGARACFVAGTQIVVGIAEDGTYITRNIEDLQEGDLVLARDQYDVKDDLDLRPVVQVFRKVSDHLRILQIEGQDGNIETIQTTDEHPFWVEGIGWVRAGDLRVGMEVDQPDGSNATVISTVYEAHPEGIAVYNFEVLGDHTYFVEDGQGGQTAIWVHNSCARRLWRNMVKAGFAAAKKAGQAVHHIIARNEARWPSARAVRDKFNTLLAGAQEGLDEFFNGVVLDAAYHAKLNCKEYYDAVLKRIEDLDTALDLITEMIKIGDELANKTFKF